MVFACPESPNPQASPQDRSLELRCRKLAGEENLRGRLQRTLRPIGQCPLFRVDGSHHGIFLLPATLGFVRQSGNDAVAKLDWAGDGAERLEAFASAQDLHVAIVEHAPDD
jgi:hypothetical protein